MTRAVPPLPRWRTTISFIVAVFGVPLVAQGQLVNCGTDPCRLREDLPQVAVNIFNLLITVGGAAAVLAIVAAGINYIVAVLQGADSSRLSNAKTMLGYAIFGTIVLLTAYVIVRSVCLALGGCKPETGIQ